MGCGFSLAQHRGTRRAGPEPSVVVGVHGNPPAAIAQCVPAGIPIGGKAGATASETVGTTVPLAGGATVPLAGGATVPLAGGATVGVGERAGTPAAVVEAHSMFEGVHQVEVDSVYDGDTLTFLLDYNGTRIRAKCRVQHIDAPEMKPPLRNPDRDEEKKAAVAARDAVRALLLHKRCTAHIGKQDKYGRLLARIQVPDGADKGRWLDEVLVERSLAVPYDGRTKAVMTFRDGKVVRES